MRSVIRFERVVRSIAESETTGKNSRSFFARTKSGVAEVKNPANQSFAKGQMVGHVYRASRAFKFTAKININIRSGGGGI